MKQGIRAIGIDDGPRARTTLIVGVVMRPSRIEAFLSTFVEEDGNDATRKIIEMIEKSRQREQIHVIFVNGIAVAGFNLVNYKKIARVLKIPVIVVTENKPNPERIRKSLEKWPEKLIEWKEMEAPAYEANFGKGTVYFQYAGCSKKQALEFIKTFTINSKIPEPLRIAHLAAAGIVLGESHGL